MADVKPQVIEATRGPFSPIDMRIAVFHVCGKQIEQCCNYEITGKNAAGIAIMLPPVTQRLMTHIRDVAD
jgi:hypothetical protein